MQARDANAALNPLGLRLARADSCPNVNTTARYVAIILRKGLKNEHATNAHVAYRADTVDGLVAQAKSNGTNYRGAETVAEVRFRERDYVSAEERAELDPQQTTDAADAVVQAASEDDSPPNGDPRLQALQTLLNGSVDEQAVRRIVRDVAGAEIHGVAQAFVDTINEHNRELDAKIKGFLKQASGAIAQTVEIKTPEQSVKVKGQHAMFPTLCREIGLGNSVFVSGPAGSGKTTACVKACEALGRPYFIMRAVLDPFEVLGYRDAQGTFQDTAVYQWATTEGAILIMDEIDRSDPNALVVLNSAWNDVIPFPHDTVNVHPSNGVIATANTWGVGTDAEYVGSARLDGATTDRFPSKLRWDYDEGLETRIAVSKGGDVSEVAFCQRLRAQITKRKIRVIWSPRSVIAHCMRVANGVSREDSLAISALAMLNDDTRSELIESCA